MIIVNTIIVPYLVPLAHEDIYVQKKMKKIWALEHSVFAATIFVEWKMGMLSSY